MVVVLAIPKAQERALTLTTLATTLATLAVGVAMLARFDYDRTGVLQFQVNKPWIDVIHSRYHMGVDGISLPLLLMNMLITVGCVIYTWDHFPDPRTPNAFILMDHILGEGMNDTVCDDD